MDITNLNFDFPNLQRALRKFSSAGLSMDDLLAAVHALFYDTEWGVEQKLETLAVKDSETLNGDFYAAADFLVRLYEAHSGEFGALDSSAMPDALPELRRKTEELRQRCLALTGEKTEAQRLAAAHEAALNQAKTLQAETETLNRQAEDFKTRADQLTDAHETAKAAKEEQERRFRTLNADLSALKDNARSLKAANNELDQKLVPLRKSRTEEEARKTKLEKEEAELRKTCDELFSDDLQKRLGDLNTRIVLMRNVLARLDSFSKSTPGTEPFNADQLTDMLDTADRYVQSVSDLSKAYITALEGSHDQ